MKVLKVPAIEAAQGAEQRVYTTVLDGRVLREVAAIARVEKSGEEVVGYQRPEVASHIRQIRKYLDSGKALMPNALVVAFCPTRVRFESSSTASEGSGRLGHLLIPYHEGCPDTEKPGFVLDGQQRLGAVRDSSLPGFPLPVSVILSSEVRVHMEQFLLCNSGRHLPKSLIYRLLPDTQTVLPDALERRKLPALLLGRLNAEPSSPFYNAVAPATPGGRIRDNSVLRMLEASLHHGGALWRFAPEGAEPDVEGMLGLLHAFWHAVAEVFPEAWAAKPSKSKLTGGVGVVTMGLLMDKVYDRLTMGAAGAAPTVGDFARELRRVAPVCRWTEGEWCFADGVRLEWCHVENTGRHATLIGNFLLREYLDASMGKGAARRARPGRRG